MIKEKHGFTLVELLVVVGVLVILTTAALLVVNPVEYLKQSRDTKRIGDLTAIDDALATTLANNPNISLGESATTVYVSIPDPTLIGNATSTCGGVAGMPVLLGGWQYQCVSAANLQKTDGTGWIPVNFEGLAARSPLSTLPIDPINSSSGRSYYTYIVQGGMTAKFESQKMIADAGAKDGGIDMALYEIGKSPNPPLPPSPPIVVTNVASSVMQTTATLNGSVNPNGDATTGWFRYSASNPGSCNDVFGAGTIVQNMGSGSSTVAYTENISGLVQDKTYYYCAIAQNGGGIVYGGMRSFRLGATYAVGAYPRSIAFDPVTNSVWTANFSSSTVSKVDINTGTRVDYVVGLYPQGIAFDPVTNSVWGVNYSSSTVSKVDIATGAKVDYTVGVNPKAIAFDPVTNSVWTANLGVNNIGGRLPTCNSSTVSKVDIITGTKVDYATGNCPYGIAFDPVTNSVWTANFSSSTVSKVSIGSGAKTDYMVGVRPQGIAFDPVTNSVWVANSGSSTVSKVDINTGTRVDYAVGAGPYGVAFDPVTNSVWVTNPGSNTVNKIPVR